MILRHLNLKVMMKVVLLEVLVVWLLGALHADTEARPELTGLGEDEQQVSRRYAESTIASEISKIMDSMVQKNFVDFLLNHRERRSETPSDPEERLHGALLGLHQKQKGNL